MDEQKGSLWDKVESAQTFWHNFVVALASKSYNLCNRMGTLIATNKDIKAV